MAKIAIVQDIYLEYLGVMYISAVLKKSGHAVEVFIEKTQADYVKNISRFNPDFVAFPVTTGMHEWAATTAKAIKQATRAKVIFGAYHPTFFPEIVEEPGVDIIIRGEAEAAMLELADKTDKHADLTDTLNCWFNIDGKIIRNEVRPLVENLDEMPFPDRELYGTKYAFMKRHQAHVIGGRGCPYNCSFCFNHAYRKLYAGKGRAIRLRSVENVIAEIQEARKTYELRTIYMQDDTFIFKKEWVMRFLEEYSITVRLPFVCMIRVDVADEDIIRALSNAGCNNVFFGLETGNEDLRNTLLNKKVTDEQIMKTAGLLKRYGIRFRTFNMLNLPGETIEDAYKTVEFNQRIKTDFPWCSLYYPYPGTELAEHAVKFNLVDTSIAKSTPSFFKTSVISSPHRNELVNLQKLFFYAVRFPVLFPLIKKAARIRPNIFFDWAFLISYAYSFFRSENLSMGDLLQIGSRNLKRFFFNK